MLRLQHVSLGLLLGILLCEHVSQTHKHWAVSPGPTSNGDYPDKVHLPQTLRPSPLPTLHKLSNSDCTPDQWKVASSQFAFLWHLSTNFLSCQHLILFFFLRQGPHEFRLALKMTLNLNPFASPWVPGLPPPFWSFLLLICRSLYNQKIILSYKSGRYLLLLYPFPQLFISYRSSSRQS